jgi:hypothetical protein
MGAERHRGRRVLVPALLFLAPTAGSAHEIGASRYDFVRHVRPLFERHCSSCHRPGGVAPMSLLRYEEASPWANAIKLKALEGRMPPFLPEEGVGSWRGARGLTAQELDVLVEWASGGAPKGRGPDEDPGASLATPRGLRADLVLSALRESVLGPEEAERSECVVFPHHLEADRAVAAIELWPGNAEVVRSAVIYQGDTCPENDRPLATWLPGQGAFEVPEGAAEVLSRGASLRARILYRKTWRLEGKLARDRSRLALRFAQGRAARLAHVSLEAGAGTTLERAVRVVAVFPRGPREAPLTLLARRPGGEAQPIFAVESFDPDWREKYVLSPPLDLPAGTRLEAAEGGFWVDYLAPTRNATPPWDRPGRREPPGSSRPGARP